MNKKIIVTTSWDDGHALDMKMAHFLRKYGLAGTFYMAPENRDFDAKDLLTQEQIKELSGEFEVGAHTMTHPRITSVGDKTAEEEIRNSKIYLEKVTGKKVTSFCYPAGYFEERHKAMTKKAGFSLARTVKRFATEIGNDSFALPTTIHAYRHWSDAMPIIKHAGVSNFLKQYLNWDALAMSFFDKVVSDGGVFHLWGHSWEIEKNNDWNRLENVFKYISGRKEIQYVTNKELT